MSDSKRIEYDVKAANAHDGTDEVSPVLRRTNLELSDLSEESILETVVPQ